MFIKRVVNDVTKNDFAKIFIINKIAKNVNYYSSVDPA